MSELGISVLSRILPANREALNTARERLTPEHFHDSLERTFFSLLDSYADRYNDVLPGKFLADMLERSGMDAAKIVRYSEAYETFCDVEVGDSSFKYAVDGLVDDFAKQKTGEAFATSYNILEKGVVVDGVTLSGHEAAREYFNRLSSEIDSGSSSEEAPEGDVREEMESFIEAYKARAALGEVKGIQSGIPALDAATGGLQNGELCLIAAYTNEGKTQMATQWAWNASITQGKNVYFSTSETVRDQVWRRFVARHSRQPQFGLPNGLNVRDLKNGTLDPDEYTVLMDVLQDLKSPDYGKMYIAQIPNGGTLTWLFNRMSQQQKLWGIDLAVCDYLPLLKAEVKRAGEREEFNDILRRTKSGITAFDHGRGLPFISPWQIRREDYKMGINSGGYTIGALSDTSEAEKVSDLIVSLLRPSPSANEATVQTLKARDDAIMSPTPVYLDYRNSYIGEAVSSGGGFSAASDDAFDMVGLV